MDDATFREEQRKMRARVDGIDTSSRPNRMAQYGDNPHRKEALLAGPERGNEAYFYQMRTANKLIRISSNIPGLIGALGEHYIRVGINLTETTSTPTEGGAIINTYPIREQQFQIDTQQMKFSCPVLPSFVVRQELSSTGLEVYVKEPTVSKPGILGNVLGGPREVSIGWAVRVQVILKGGDQRDWHIPAPEPRDPLQYDNARHGNIDFFKTKQAFWADEVYYRVEI